MRPIARSIAAAAAVALLGLGLTACGGDDDPAAGDRTPSGEASSDATGSPDGSDGTAGAATDGSSPTAAPLPADSELCSALSDIIEVVDPIEGAPDEDQWAEIQERYAALGDVELPDDTPERISEGRDVSVRAITSLSLAEAERAFGNKSGKIPKLSVEEARQAAEFFNWAGQRCPSVLGTADAEPSSITTQ